MRFGIIMILACIAAAPGMPAPEPQTRRSENWKDRLAFAQADLSKALENMSIEQSRWEATMNAAWARWELNPEIAALKAKKLDALENLVRIKQNVSLSAFKQYNAAQTDYEEAERDYHLAKMKKLISDPEVEKAQRARAEALARLYRAKQIELDIRLTIEAEERAIDLAIREKATVSKPVPSRIPDISK